MRLLSILLITASYSLGTHKALAQRAHEVQVFVGVTSNHGVSFYDYPEIGTTKRHNFEFDQKYTSLFYEINWSYPISNQVGIGLFYSRSIRATLNLLEAESLLFDSDSPGTRDVSYLYSGTTRLASSARELGGCFRINILRFQDFKTYFLGSGGYKRISSIKKNHNVVEAEDPGLQNHLLKTYLKSEDLFTIGYGFGLSCLLKNGVNVKIVEVLGKNNTGSSLMLSAANSIEIRTGLSYQFYRKQ